ncbi:MAG: SDR family oxidoreductase [Phaeodactylibacter sp.]|nr:SDR family oxidoreductase [Phaeodactylibacter sp.]
MADENKTALITGAGSGIGRACALALLDRGWHVVLAGRRQAPLEETARMAGAHAPRAVPIPTDVGSRQAVSALFEAVKGRFGRLDLLFNNVGQALPSMPFEEVPYEAWADNMHTNITGTFLCSQAAFQLMKAQSPMGGRIINNGAPSAHVPRPDGAAFTVAKHAITGFTKALALEGRRHNIACGQIDIGNVEPPGGAPQHASKQANGTRLVEDTMDMKAVTDTFLLMAELPIDTNVLSVMVMPAKMPYVGRG